MTSARITGLATTIVFATGIIWGVYWIPVRALGDLGLGGAWGTAIIALAAALCLTPSAWRHRRGLRDADGLMLVSLVFGGAAFALYSIGFLYGRVAIVVLLYCLSPVWSTLIARFLLGWETPPMRLWAIAVGLGGLSMMLGSGGGMPLPRSSGEWMGLAAGVFWSVGTTGMRTRPALPPVPATFVFALGGAGTSLLLVPFLGAAPAPKTADLWTVAALVIVTGGVWWAASIAALTWATVRLEPARVGILLMSEVLVGAATAAWLAGEILSPRELIGGAFVLLAGLLEVWPVKRAPGRTNEKGPPPRDGP